MRKYYFQCDCCERKSKHMTSETYIRLQFGEVWVAKGCEVEGEVVRKDFLGGSIVVKADF